MVFRLDNLEEIEPWVLTWGAHATVVRPKLLADRVLAAAADLQKKYTKPIQAKEAPAQTQLDLASRSVTAAGALPIPLRAKKTEDWVKDF